MTETGNPRTWPGIFRLGFLYGIISHAMLEKPALPDETILAWLSQVYGLPAGRLFFLPLGVDGNAAVYRVEGADGPVYFLKLRRGACDPLSVELQQYLHEGGISQVIAPIPTLEGQGWARRDAYTLILYPFVAGVDAYQARLSEQQWVELGEALRRLHVLDIPPGLSQRLRREDYSPRWRRQLREFQRLAERSSFHEPVAARLAEFMHRAHSEIDEIAGQAERLALRMKKQPPEFVLCHADLHPGNLLLQADGRFWIVDWDAPILARRERDLMFIGAGMGGVQPGGPEEEWFYQGYGAVAVDRTALAYYRYERIVQDLAVYCEQLFLSEQGGDDREQALAYFMSNFEPGNTLEAARGCFSSLLIRFSAIRY